MKCTWFIDKQYAGMTIHAFLKQQQFSRRFLKKLKVNGGKVFVNDEISFFRYVLKEGETLRLLAPEEKRPETLQPNQMELDIVYEDDAILILNKRAGLPTIPSIRDGNQSLASGILAYYDEKNLPYTVHIVTRLDRDTSGLVLVAKHRHSHALLAEQQKEHKIKRIYTAIVEGHVKEAQGTITSRIMRKPDSIIERIVHPNGQIAITHFWVKEVHSTYSKIEVELETGRTHQIRVHFAHKGHALLGDTLYGNAHALINRQALHCQYLAFSHPLTGIEMTFTACLPEDLQRL